VLVCKSGERLTTKVYKKPTATGQYLNYESNHAGHVKLAIAQGMFLRTLRYTTNESDRQAEIDVVESELRNNGYPVHVLHKALKKAKQNYNLTADPQIKEKPLTTVVIPYVKGLSEKIRRINSKYNIRTAFKNNTDLRKMLTHIKPKNEEQELKNAVYNIPCSCGKNYYGQTSRPTKIRIDEHKKLIKRADPKNSKLVEHVLTTNHSVGHLLESFSKNPDGKNETS